ncbi:MAG: winged helix DNA-binding domain-containing protein [Dermatophilus congolensis]|nr:winged helix DNA-binding domain-containing protein [Dermatophilus congolensis]
MRFSDDARRARLARRHALHPEHRVADPLAAARAMTVLHATEPPSVHLSIAARMNGADVASVERVMYEDRSLVKQLAMRRTLFAAPRELLPALLGSSSARVALQQRNVIAKDLEKHGITPDGAAWIARATAAVLDRLSDGSALSARQLREQLPELEGRTTPAPGAKSWDVPSTFAPRILTLLGAEGRLVRGANEGHWSTSRPTWTLMSTWLGEVPAPLEARAGYAELVRRYLASFGPATEDDIVWWFGTTKSAVRSALADVEAMAVQLDSRVTGFVLPGDETEDPDVGEWTALLPVLDPTTMGWKARDFYLDPAHVPYLFDSNGNGGTTAWLDGRIVGCWVQDDDARVRVVPTEKLKARDRKRLDAEADRLTAFLDGVVISSVYKSQQMKGERLP